MLMNHSPKAVAERIEQERAVLRKVQPLVRSPLKRGNRYQFHGYSVGIEITHVAFRGHEEDDGGLQGVGIKWWGYPKKREGGFYPCASDSEFFDMLTFRNVYDVLNRAIDGKKAKINIYKRP